MQLNQSVTNPISHAGQRWPFAVMAVAVAGIFFLLVKLGLSFTPENLDISPIWPPSGFSTVALFLLGFRYIPSIAVGSLLAMGMFTDIEPWYLLQIASIHTLEGVVAASLLRLYRFKPAMTQVRDSLALPAATFCGSCVVAASLGTLMYATEGQLSWGDYWDYWRVYWVSNATANLALAPMLFTWLAPTGALGRMAGRRKARNVEFFFLGLTAISLSYLVSFSHGNAHPTTLKYLLFPCLVWAALRAGPRGASLIIVLSSLTAIYGALALQDLSGADLRATLLQTQLFIAVFGISGMLMAAVAEERAASFQELATTKENLEARVAERTADLERSTAVLQAILDNVGSSIIAVDQNGALSNYNRSAAEMYRFLPAYKGATNWAEDFKLFQSDGRTLLTQQEVPLYKALCGIPVFNAEVTTRVGEDQDLRHLLVSGQPLLGTAGENSGAIVVAHDVTELKHAERLQQLYHRSAIIANEAPDKEQATISILDLVCEYTGWNVGHALEVRSHNETAFAVSTGWWNSAEVLENLKEFQDSSRHFFFEGDDLPGRVLASGKAELLDVATESKLPRLKKLQKPRFASAVAFPVFSASQNVGVLEFFSIKRVEFDKQLLQTMKFICDQLGHVYERSEATQQLVKMTLRDPLTGLPNRLAFHDIIRQALAHARRREHYSFAVLFIDLDRFKLINDSLGHAAGDAVIKETAARIKMCLREGDAVARLGGDEFTVLLDDLGERSDSAHAAKVARRISEQIAQPLLVENEEVFLSCSIGIVISSSTYEHPEDMLRDADAAMYRAKAAGKARFEIFSSEMHTQAMNLLRLENDLRRALERNEFTLHYQPIIHLTDRTLLGFEALIRWNHPEKGLLLPGEFLPVAEETGLITPMGQWILTEACGWIKRVNSQLPKSKRVSVSVNVAGAQFVGGTIAAQVQTALLVSCVEPRYLKLEIVESTLMRNPAAAVTAMESLRTLGIKVMIDDFGTGYSSLSYLSRLPIDVLKIDRSFVSDMTGTGSKVEVVRSIIGMATALHLDVIAEGIESEEHVLTLLEYGCNVGQGFYLARPMPGKVAAKLARESVSRSVFQR